MQTTINKVARLECATFFGETNAGNAMADIKSDTAVLAELLTITGTRIADIGSGDGNLVRFLTRHGAHVTGLECGAAQLAKARAHAPAGDETYIEGVAQHLPFNDASFDTAIFFNSLHHVPVAGMDQALTEAARIIVPGGNIYIAEPVAAGSGYEFSKPVDDEAEVRAAACQAMRRAVARGLTEVCEVTYDTVYHYADFSAFKEENIRIDPARRSAIAAAEPQLRAAFERLGVAGEQGTRFDQPMRVNLLHKA